MAVFQSISTLFAILTSSSPTFHFYGTCSVPAVTLPNSLNRCNRLLKQQVPAVCILCLTHFAQWNQKDGGCVFMFACFFMFFFFS